MPNPEQGAEELGKRVIPGLMAYDIGQGKDQHLREHSLQAPVNSDVMSINVIPFSCVPIISRGGGGFVSQRLGYLPWAVPVKH